MRLDCVLENTNGGFFIPGHGYDAGKYASIIKKYETIINEEGSCSTRKLALAAGVSRSTASKAITILNDDFEVVNKKHGRPKDGLGSRFGMTSDHHMIIYELYLENPSRPREDYCRHFEQATGIPISTMFISRWFDSIGPYKGRMRVTSLFPPKKYTLKNLNLFNEYVSFIMGVQDKRRLVFADEKPMFEADTYGSVRRNPINGDIPHHSAVNINSKKRHNILAAISVKGYLQRPVEAVVLDMNGDSTVFQEFVFYLLRVNFLTRGDIFIVDNCTIHFFGENEFLMEALWHQHHIVMIPLPPYTPELNPTELVFNSMAARISSKRSRAEFIIWGDDFSHVIRSELDQFTFYDVINFYRHCGYQV
jgi:hypothetical protein